MVAALAGLVAWRRLRRGGAGALEMILSLPVAGLGAAFEFAAMITPPFNDIATYPDDPPMFWATETPTEYPAANAQVQRDA